MIPTPTEIKTYLDRHVVGQEKAKWTLSVAVSNHYRAVAYEGPTRIQKSNILVIGPTGSGKTFMIETIARMLSVPFAKTSATSITPPGWAGADPDQCIKDLVASSRRINKDNKPDWAAVQRGIVYIDEVDKMAQQRDGTQQQSSGFTNISVQQSLLKLVEGDTVVLSGTPVSTDGILFIASGAFVGLDQKVVIRENKGRVPPKFKPDPHALRRVLPQDLIGYGLIPEFVGRFPVVTSLDPLTADDLVRVIRDVDHSLIEQMQARASVTGSDILVDDSVVRLWAHMALEQGTGARGLRTMIEKRLEEVWKMMQEGDQIILTATGIEVRGGRGPLVPSADGLAEASESPRDLPAEGE